jgi:HNH endonuclease
MFLSENVLKSIDDVIDGKIDSDAFYEFKVETPLDIKYFPLLKTCAYMEGDGFMCIDNGDIIGFNDIYGYFRSDTYMVCGNNQEQLSIFLDTLFYLTVMEIKIHMPAYTTHMTITERDEYFSLDSNKAVKRSTSNKKVVDERFMICHSNRDWSIKTMGNLKLYFGSHEVNKILDTIQDFIAQNNSPVNVGSYNSFIRDQGEYGKIINNTMIISEFVVISGSASLDNFLTYHHEIKSPSDEIYIDDSVIENTITKIFSSSYTSTDDEDEFVRWSVFNNEFRKYMDKKLVSDANLSSVFETMGFEKYKKEDSRYFSIRNYKKETNKSPQKPSTPARQSPQQSLQQSVQQSPQKSHVVSDGKRETELTSPVKAAKNGRKKPIPPKMKGDIWSTHMGNVLKSKCYACLISDIAATSYHAGHIESEAKGGEITVRNIRPICQSCNSSMGTNHMFEWLKDQNMKGWNNALKTENMYIYLHYAGRVNINIEEFYEEYSDWCGSVKTTPQNRLILEAYLRGMDILNDEGRVIIK